MIIFGTRSHSRLLAIINLVCGNCGNPAAQRVITRVMKFTLFFIPLFPFSRTYTVNCVYCGSSTRISKEHAASYEEFASNAAIEKQLDAEFGPQPSSESNRAAD